MPQTPVPPSPRLRGEGRGEGPAGCGADQLGPGSRSSISRKFCTAAPDAPLPRLSSCATSTAWRRAGVALDLRHVLVLEAERVQLEGRPAGAIMRRDQGSSTARIAADRAYRDRVVGWDDPRLDQRAQ